MPLNVSNDVAEPARPVAIVTGAGSGIGRAVARALYDAGYDLALAGRRTSALDETAARMHGAGAVLTLAADVTNAASVAALFDQTRERFGRLDLLFNNAGVSAPDVPLDELPVERLLAVFNVNLIGATLCARQAFRLMKAQTPQGGRIINNGSVSAYAPRPNNAPYAAAKHGITGLTKSLILDGRPFNIVCSQIDIGNTATEMSAKMTTGAKQADGRIALEPRFDVVHVAQTVVTMAGLPIEANMPFVTIMASGMPLYGRG